MDMTIKMSMVFPGTQIIKNPDHPDLVGVKMDDEEIIWYNRGQINQDQQEAYQVMAFLGELLEELG